MQSEKLNFSTIQQYFDNQSSLLKPKTEEQIREKYRLNLLKYFDNDNQIRQMEKKFLNQKKKQIKINNASNKSLKIEQKFNQQKQKYSIIMKEREDQMKLLDEKLCKSTRSAPDTRASSEFNK